MAVTNSWPDKGPADILDYSIDWTEQLGSDTITGAPVWSCADPSLTLTGDTLAGAVASIFLSGGTIDTTYTVYCEIDTVGGRTFKRGVNILVTDR